jgi:hypothetical protein
MIQTNVRVSHRSGLNLVIEPKENDQPERHGADKRDDEYQECF